MHSVQKTLFLALPILFLICAGKLLGGFTVMVCAVLSAAAAVFTVLWILESAAQQPALIRVRSQAPCDLNRRRELW